MACASSKDNNGMQLSPQMCNSRKAMMKVEQCLRNASQMISRCQNVLYSERRKELHFSYQVKAEGWVFHCLSTPKAGKETEKAAGPGRHTSWPYYLQKD